MTEQDYIFLDDQKTLRVGRCTNIEERLSESDIRYRRRILNEEDAKLR